MAIEGRCRLMTHWKIVDEQEVVQWLEEDRAYSWMVSAYLAKYDVETTVSTWGSFRRGLGRSDTSGRLDTVLSRAGMPALRWPTPGSRGSGTRPDTSSAFDEEWAVQRLLDSWRGGRSRPRPPGHVLTDALERVCLRLDGESGDLHLTVHAGHDPLALARATALVNRLGLEIMSDSECPAEVMGSGVVRRHLAWREGEPPRPHWGSGQGG